MTFKVPGVVGRLPVPGPNAVLLSGGGPRGDGWGVGRDVPRAQKKLGGNPQEAGGYEGE